MVKKEGLLNVPVIGQNYFEEASTGTKYLNPKELISFRRRVLFKYHARPSYIFGKIKDSFSDYRKFLNYTKYGYRLLKNLIN